MKFAPLLLVAILLASVFTLASNAFADRAIVTPLAVNLQPKQVSFEYLYGLDHHARRATFASVGLNTFEIELSHLQFPGNDHYALSIQDGLLPETFYTPAVAVGVRDIFGSARHSDQFGYAARSVYVTANKMLLGTQTSSYPFHNATFSVGVGTGVPRAIFGSLSAESGLGFNQSIEFDGKGLNYQLDRLVGRIARIEYVRLHGANFIGAQLQTPTNF